MTLSPGSGRRKTSPAGVLDGDRQDAIDEQHDVGAWPSGPPLPGCSSQPERVPQPSSASRPMAGCSTSASSPYFDAIAQPALSA